MNVGMPLFDADESGLLIWQFKRTEILFRTSTDSSLETGGSVWHAAHKLSEYLVKNPYLVRNKRVLELGCGCGLVGLVAASLGAKSVVLSDIDSQIPIIEKNIELNKYARTVRSKASQDFFIKCDVKCTSIWFGENISEDFEDQYDVILGADIGYDYSLHEPLATTIASGLVNKRVIALLSEEVRWSDIYSWYVDGLVNKRLQVHDTEHDGDDEQYQSGPAPQTSGGSFQLNLNSGSDSPPHRPPSPLLKSHSNQGNGTIYNNENLETISGSFDNIDYGGRLSDLLSGSLGRSNSNSKAHYLLSSIVESESEKDSDKSTSPVVIKYPCHLSTSTTCSSTDSLSSHMEEKQEIERTFSGDAATTDHDTRLLHELIRGIYAKIPNKQVEKSAIKLAYRTSKCPVKVLKVTKKTF